MLYNRLPLANYLHMVVYVCQPYLPVYPTLLFPTVFTSLLFTSTFYSCPENGFICTIFLNSTYMNYTIFVLLFLTSLCKTDFCSCCLVVSDSSVAHGLLPTRLLYPWNFPGKNTGVGCPFLLQGIFLTQGSNLCLLHWQVDPLLLSHQGSMRDSRSIQKQ